MKQSLGIAALVATGALAIPAAAIAHPSVYPTTANTAVAVPNTTPTQYTLEAQTRYVVTNHGFTIVLRETNRLNATSAAAADKVKGVVGYNLIPSNWRNQAGQTFASVMAVGGTGAQAHATCLTPALETEAAIKSWQDADAFYNYVPFQATAAGLEDDPARWLPTLTAAGFDTSRLGTAAAAEAECEKVAGAEYVAADTVQTTSAALAEGLTKPLDAQVTTLTTTNAALTNEVEELKKTVFATSPLQSQVNALTAQLATATAAAKPLTLTLSKASTAGVDFTIAGPPSSKGNVVVSLTAAQAKKLKLKSTTIAKGTFTAAANGNATASLKLTAAAKKALKKFTGTVTAEATSADRFATAKRKFTK